MKVRTGAGSKDDEHTKAPRERPIRNFGQSERGRSPVQRATSCASSARASWCEPVSYCHFHSVARAILSLLERVKRPTEPSPPPPCPLATAGGAGGAGRTPQAIGGAQRCRANVPGCDGTSAAVVITVSIPIRLFMPAIIIGDQRHLFVSPKTVAHGFVKRFCATDRFEKLLREPVSQTVSYFTVPPRAHPSTGSQSGSATPGLTQVPKRPWWHGNGRLAVHRFLLVPYLYLELTSICYLRIFC